MLVRRLVLSFYNCVWDALFLARPRAQDGVRTPALAGGDPRALLPPWPRPRCACSLPVLPPVWGQRVGWLCGSISIAFYSNALLFPC
jgi:hypothetical protein